jgi:ribonuclease HI
VTLRPGSEQAVRRAAGEDATPGLPFDPASAAVPVVAYIDGGARGNPGPAGFGVYIVDDQGQVLAEIAEGIGIATNNVAEYRGLLAALQWAVEHGVTALHVRGDSLLLVQQMRGVYKVKNAGLIPLHREARRLSAHIGAVTFEHVPRAKNVEADRLSNLGMDQNVPVPEG